VAGGGTLTVDCSPAALGIGRANPKAGTGLAMQLTMGPRAGRLVLDLDATLPGPDRSGSPPPGSVRPSPASAPRRQP
jgi:hypothetical protein